ncbi:MAG: hypothetical protein QM817_05000 [Archangium sp.]
MLPALTMILAASPPDPALLEKLGAQAQSMESLWNSTACTIDVDAEEQDGAGKVTKTVKTSLRVARDGKNVTRKLISHQEDGKDLTEAKRKEIEGKEGSKVSKSPFHPDEQKKYRFDQKDPTHITFEPLGSKTEDNLIGEATIDPDTQTVKALDMHPAKFPMFVQELGIRVEFDANTSNGKGMSALNIKGLAGALFFKKRFVVKTRFSDYAAP